jgi:Fe(II)/alpha-ketoglutarate-dependent arginine beta-hydroxylase
MKSQANIASAESFIRMRPFTLQELTAIEGIATRLIKGINTVESEVFADDVALAAEELPLSLRLLARDFRVGHGPQVLWLKGLDIQEGDLMGTPESWDCSWTESRILALEVRHALVASLFGYIFGWHTQENGRFFRHIIPNRADEREQLGSSSAVDLEWHNEEAFHPSRADAILMMCYRNHERAETTVCPSATLELDPATVAILRQARFVILPDKSHRPDFNKSSQWQLAAADFQRIEAMLTDPAPQPILTGPMEAPYIRIDPAFMHAIDAESAAALETIKAEVGRKLHGIVLEPGDLLLVDNLRAVHGRRSYRPNYGPRQRWMRRVNLTADLAKGGQNLVAGSKRRFL